MKPIFPPSIALIVSLAPTGACLGPLTDDTVDPSRFFGDPNVDPMTLHIERDPKFAGNVLGFGKSVVYLNGFADHQPIHYWNIDGPNATFIAPLFEITGPDGKMIGHPIIDAIPGDAGYTPWWRRIIVRAKPSYNNERIWSREAIDAGIKKGILEDPEEQAEVIDAAVLLERVKIPVDVDKTVDPTWAWYRNRRVSWIEIKKTLPVPKGVREMPNFPVYVLQRINQPSPIYEFLTGVDITNDGDLDDTNNIFASNIDGPRYSTLWYAAFVHVVPSYPSIDDTRSSTVGLSAENDFLSPDGKIISPYVSSQGITPAPQFLINCPLQATKGEL
jgi:hypothetical protein